MTRRIDIDPGSGELRIRFEYNRELVDKVRELPRRRWSPADKAWFVPMQQANAVIQALRGHRFSVSGEVQRLIGGLHGEVANDDGAEEARALRRRAPARAPAPAPAPARRRREKKKVEGEEGKWTPSRLNTRVRDALRGAFPDRVWVVGEITGWSRNAHRSPVFFELVEKDNMHTAVRARVACVLFDSARRAIEEKLAAASESIELDDGVQVCVQCRVDLYEPHGRYQLLIRDIDPYHTLGALAQQRDRVLSRLEALGISGRNKALAVPMVPLRVGLITSKGSDAYKDVINELSRSGFAFSVYVWDARMQGRNLEPTVQAGLKYFALNNHRFDVVAIVRGGGSRTDLAWFDTVPLGESVCNHPLPVLVGIGHHQDRSALDEVAALSLKTPTAVGKFLIDRVAEFESALEDFGEQLLLSAHLRVREAREDLIGEAGRLTREARHRVEAGSAAMADALERLDGVCRARARRDERELDTLVAHLPEGLRHRMSRERDKVRLAAARLTPAYLANVTSSDAEALDGLVDRLDRGVSVMLERQRSALTTLDVQAKAHDPVRVLKRGYALVRKADGGLLRRPSDVGPETTLHLELAEGQLTVSATPQDAAQITPMEDETP